MKQNVTRPNIFSLKVFSVLMIFLSGCDSKVAVPVAAGADNDGFSAPTEFTVTNNRTVLKRKSFQDDSDFTDARRGLIAQVDRLQIDGDEVGRVWDMPVYDFLANDAYDSINPSLQRMARLNNLHGLFEVAPGVYQLRGYDLANMTIIEGESGWIVVDPLTSTETARAALALAREHLGDKPIKAIIYTHSHIDHFGGVLGISSIEEARQQAIRIIAPQGFMNEATSENILAGPAMSRRAIYMYGRDLPRSARGHVDSGIGKTPAFGTHAIIAPTEIVDATGQQLAIDGVQVVFQIISGSEAPAEFAFYLPQKKVFCGAELATHTLHNLYTLRGTKVRDGLAWSGFIQEAARMFADADVLIGAHHWPMWGRDRIQRFLQVQGDTYKYIHDQTLRLANAGFTPREIAEELELPAALRGSFGNADYYGTVSHNSKAVYQAYFGWYDGNPANLNPLPPTEAGKRYVQFMGGAENVMSQAQASFDAGDYRWVAEVLNHLVMSNPDNVQARALLARTYDQLGYQAESAPWRDVYLAAAYELRFGATKQGVNVADAKDLLKEASAEDFLAALAVRLNGPDAEGKKIVINMDFTDLGQNYVVTLENSVLHFREAPVDSTAAATLHLTRDAYLSMSIGGKATVEALLSDDISFEGSTVELVNFFTLFDKPKGLFPIVTP